MNYQKVEFKLSAASAAQFPRDGYPQIAFAGKSNVGKSSVINRVLQRKNFAYTGASPGKTIHINYFMVDETAYLVDLPGYGYAKVSQKEKERWGRLMESYFAEPDLITLGILIVDARHAPTQNDVTMASWFQQTGCPFVVVANKLDKLKKREIEPNLACIREVLSLSEDTILLPFSAEKGTGRDQLVGIIEAAAAGKLSDI
jgi:GTP-binding protein